MLPKKRTTSQKQEGGITKKKTSLARRKAPPKVFISYSHLDERYKNELVTMLKGLENQKIITVWQDRSIQPGVEWLEAIKLAMSKCQMALLLISKHFLASPFIQTEELPALLRQRIDDGLLVIPIILRPCLWGKDPILSRLQALPSNARPIANYRPCKRDQIWTEIAEAIEHLIK